ncbi:MAG: uncharacterized protein JWP13_12 [Candidatus Saccharibacteria bacterium]|nr:uncharacterized protein [Candidatus Saccharibacteria bacterium]
MATYKVLQDIEAEDKLIGPLTLRQCIYAAVAIIAGYLAYIAIAKGAAFLAIFFLPFIGFGLFFAWPWGQQQTTEVWALAKVRFALKPRKRIWDQSGVKDLVTVTAPKNIAGPKFQDISENEVRSRLKALADTIDSRGWAVKNVPINMYTQAYVPSTSDRLLEPSMMPQEVPNYSVTPSDDIFDIANNPLAQQFETKMTAASAAKYQQLVQQVDHPRQAAAQVADQTTQNYWYLSQSPSPTQDAASYAAPMAAIPQAATPTAEEEALVQEIKRQQDILNNVHVSPHIRTIQPLSVQEEQARVLAAAQAAQSAPVQATAQNPEPPVTPEPNPAILELANNNDLNVATLAREAQHRNPESTDEVVVSLH